MRREGPSRTKIPVGTILSGVYAREAEVARSVRNCRKARHGESGPQVAIRERSPIEMAVCEKGVLDPTALDGRDQLDDGLRRLVYDKFGCLEDRAGFASRFLRQCRTTSFVEP